MNFFSLRSPKQSSSTEAEQLSSLQKSMEEKRAVLRELLVTYTKLSPHLSRSERAATQTELTNLQEKWTDLERDVERTLHHINIYSHEKRTILSEIIQLQESLETVSKDLEAKSPPVTQWNCKKAQQLMEANAEVKSAQQKYLYLQQRSEALFLSSSWPKESKEIKEQLQTVKDKISHTEELVLSQTQNSSNPIMEKIIVVMRDGLAWAKQTESDIEGRRKRVALLPEEVHRQLRDLKKLQSDMMTKQGQLEALVEEVSELLPQLDQAEEVPMVRSCLGSFEELSKSTTEKLVMAVRDIESGLQTREKLSQQIADLDSWVVAYLHNEVSRSADSELRSPTELDRRVRQIQETLTEAEKHAAVCAALLMRFKDLSPELTFTENCQIFEKLTKLQKNIQDISSYETTNRTELDHLIQSVDSSQKNLVVTEKSLRQIMVDLSRHKFPITRESLQTLESFKQMILEHKCQVDLLQPWIPKEKTKGLHSVISDLLSKIAALEMKSCDHEKYVNVRQDVENLKENVQEQVLQTKEDSIELEDRYKVCQTLLIQIPLIKCMCEEARTKLQIISADLYPSQLTTERLKLKQSEESLDTRETMIYNNLSIFEWNLVKELDFESEKKSAQVLLQKIEQELQKLPVLEPNETAINNEFQRIMSLKKTVEWKMRAVELLEQKRESRKGSDFQDLMGLKSVVIKQCDSQMASFIVLLFIFKYGMLLFKYYTHCDSSNYTSVLVQEDIVQARESLRCYTCKVKKAARFLREIEVSLLPLQGSAGLCSEELQGTQQALEALQQHFQTHVEQLQSQVALHPYLSPQKAEQLQENILSQLLVRMSTLQAKGHVRLERLSRYQAQCQIRSHTC